MSQYPWTLLAVYVVTTGSVQLLALWAAYSPRPWLLRAMVVWTPIALLATIRAYEPAILLLMSAALTIGICLALERYWPRVPSSHPRPPLWRFRLADLLVVMLFVATWFALMGRGVGTILAHLMAPVLVALFAMPLALLTIFARRSVTGPNRWTMALLAAGVIWASAILLRIYRSPLYLSHGPYALGPSELENEFFWLGSHAVTFIGAIVSLTIFITARQSAVAGSIGKWWRRGSVVVSAIAIAIFIPMAWLAWELFWVVSVGTWSNRILEVTIHSIYFVATAGMIACATWLTHIRRDASSAFMRRTAHATSLILSGLAAAAGAWIFWQMLWYAPYPRIDREAVNHYDDVVKIAKHVRQFDGSTMPLPPAVQSQMDEAMVLLRSQTHMPLHLREPAFWGIKVENALYGNDVRSLLWRFQEAADRAFKEGNADLAVDYSVAIIRFDAMVAKGAGTHAQPGFQRITLLRHKVSSTTAREIADLLDRTISERDSAEYIAAWEHAEFQKRAGWQQKLKSVLAATGTQPVDLSGSVKAINDARKPSDTIIRLLQADLAIRAFEKKRGRLPDSIAELSPEYVHEPPIDPYSGQPLRYKRLPRPWTQSTPGWFLLYSVGPDGIDDGGKFLKQPVQPGQKNYDLRLEPLRGQ